MGYRNFLYIVDNKKFNKIKKLNSEQLWDLIGRDKAFDEDELTHAPHWRELENYIDLKEAFEFGKGIDFYKRIKKYLKPAFKDKEVHKWYNDDTEFMLAKPEILAECALIFKEKVTNYYEDLLKEKSDYKYDTRSQLDRLLADARSHLSWAKFLDYLPENEYSLGGGWLYEHEVFTLQHLRRIFNPKKQLLIWIGC